jgi:CHASE2 domain-containing sensor protein
MPLVARVAGQPVPSLAIEMFRVGLGAPRTEILLDRRGIAQVRVGELLVPSQSSGEVHVHFARASDTRARYVSALDVLSDRVDAQVLSGKLVLIGLTGMGLNDMRMTALGEHVPGIEIQAQLIESLFDQRFLLRPWWMIFAEIAFTLIVGALMIWLVPRVQPSHRLGAIYRLPKAGVLASLGINAVAVSTGFYLFRAHGLMFDAASFFLVTSAVFGMLFTFVQASAARAREAQRERQWQEMVERVGKAEAALAARSRVSGE